MYMLHASQASAAALCMSDTFRRHPNPQCGASGTSQRSGSSKQPGSRSKLFHNHVHLQLTELEEAWLSPCSTSSFLPFVTSTASSSRIVSTLPTLKASGCAGASPLGCVGCLHRLVNLPKARPRRAKLLCAASLKQNGRFCCSPMASCRARRVAVLCGDLPQGPLSIRWQAHLSAVQQRASDSQHKRDSATAAAHCGGAECKLQSRSITCCLHNFCVPQLGQLQQQQQEA